MVILFQKLFSTKWYKASDHLPKTFGLNRLSQLIKLIKPNDIEPSGFGTTGRQPIRRQNQSSKIEKFVEKGHACEDFSH